VLGRRALARVLGRRALARVLGRPALSRVLGRLRWRAFWAGLRVPARVTGDVHLAGGALESR